MNFVITVALLICTHILIWFGTNAQLIDGWARDKGLYICLILAVPTSLFAFYSTKYGYMTLGTLWSTRLLAFGISYLVFPALTWAFLSENPFNTKTLICILLSMIIVLIQVLVPNT